MVHAAKGLAVAHLQVEDKTSILRSLFIDDRLENLLVVFRGAVEACCAGGGGGGGGLYGSRDAAMEVLRALCDLQTATVVTLTTVLPTAVLGAMAADLGNGLEAVGGGGVAAAAMLGTIGASVMCAAGREEAVGDGAQLLLRTVMLIDAYMEQRREQQQQQQQQQPGGGQVDEEEVVADTKLILALLAMIQNAGQECPTVIVGLDNCNDVLVSVIRMALRQLMQVRELRDYKTVLEYAI